MKEWLKEKPKRAQQVMPTLIAVTLPVPRRCVRRSLSRLDTMVPTEIIINTAPDHERGTPIS